LARVRSRDGYGDPDRRALKGRTVRDSGHWTRVRAPAVTLHIEVELVWYRVKKSLKTGEG
jgi:hypothetical protein